MKRTLYLHIGNHRTATSSIQTFMKANFHALLGRGVFHPFGVARHDGLMTGIFNGDRDIDEISETIHARADGRKARITTVTLSDEDIVLRRNLKPLAAFRKHFDVRIIFSLRRQDLWLESWYFQNIKWQWNPDLAHCTFDTFLAKREDFHWLHYGAFVGRLEKLFGRENIHLTVFEKQQMPDGPIAAFCRILGIDDISGFPEVPHLNSSMSAEMIEFIRHMPLDQLPQAARNVFRKTFEEIDQRYLGNTSKQSERLMSTGQRQEILARYAAGNRAIAEKYFDRDRLFLDPVETPEAGRARLVLPDDTSELLHRFVAPLVLELVRNGSVAGGK